MSGRLTNLILRVEKWNKGEMMVAWMSERPGDGKNRGKERQKMSSV